VRGGITRSYLGQCRASRPPRPSDGSLPELCSHSLLAQRPPEPPRFGAPHQRHDSPFHRRCRHQQALPFQAHKSRPRSSRSVSFVASRQRNRWSGVVKGNATTVTNLSSAVISASACSTSSRATTRRTTPLQTPRQPEMTRRRSWMRLQMLWWYPYMLWQVYRPRTTW
jgi:hypothetical protein